MLKEDKEFLIRNLASFYSHHTPPNSVFETLLEVYDQSLQLLYFNAKNTELNTTVQNSTLLEIIPYFQLNAENAWYDNSLAQTITSYSEEAIISLLEERKMYITLNFPNINPTPKVLQLKLQHEFSSSIPLEEGTDYILDNNRIFLLPKTILHFKKTDVFHGFDIVVNHYYIEQNFGTLNGLDFGDLLTREDVKRMTETFEYLLSSKLTVREIREAVRTSTGWMSFDILDRLSPNLAPWRRGLIFHKNVSPCLFYVVMPEEATSDPVKTHFVYYLLDAAKEAQTHYSQLFRMVREDTLNADDKAVVKTLTFGDSYDEDFYFDGGPDGTEYDCYD
jgi:hypothetical protein